MKTLKIGTKIKFVSAYSGGMAGVTLGKKYKISGYDWNDDPVFKDDNGDENAAAECFEGQYVVVGKKAKFKPAKLKLSNGETIYIAAATDSAGVVDIKVVTKNGEDVDQGILVAIAADGLWRIREIGKSLGVPLDDSRRLKIYKQ